MKMKRFHWALSALVLGIPIRASAKCGGVNYIYYYYRSAIGDRSPYK